MVPLILLTLATVAVFLLLDASLTQSRTLLGIHPKVVEMLEASLEDQKTLARLLPEDASRYRKRFNDTENSLHHLAVLRHSRQQIARRLAITFTILLGVALALVMGVEALRSRRDRRRLDHLRQALDALSVGHTGVEVGDHRRDTIGRIGRMIEDVSGTLGLQRHRLAALSNLERWQEAIRRQAHELRTPLSAARLELDRLHDTAVSNPPDCAVIKQYAMSIGEELDGLGAMVGGFASFARLSKPQLEPISIRNLLEEFVRTFAAAWPNLCFASQANDVDATTNADRNQIRQVLVNLCENSSLATSESRCQVSIELFRISENEAALDVRDDGPGVSSTIKDRIFEPYVTTREVGEGSGLGLAIGRKIMLEHGGDLELIENSGSGTVFRMTFPIIRSEATQ